MRTIARCARPAILFVVIALLLILAPRPANAGEEPAVPVIYLPMVGNPPPLLPAPAGMVSIPAGAFQMGCSPDDDPNCYSRAQPQHSVTLSAYAIDKYEVTNARYAACVSAGACSAPGSTQAYSYARGQNYEYYDVAQYANFPMINVTWFQASDFCAWDGKRLPSEAEWEKAARGTDARIYPWGNADLTCSHANVNNQVGAYCVGETTTVGAYPSGASPYGALDMSGNVWEWVNDWYAASYYATSPTTNPQGPATGSDRVLRGGSWGQLCPVCARFVPGLLLS